MQPSNAIHSLAVAAVLLFMPWQAQASVKLSCPMADGSSFELDGRHIGVLDAVLGLITLHSATPSDQYEFAYRVQYRPANGPSAELPFHDEQPKCEHYHSANGVVYAYSDLGVQRTPGEKQDVWSPMFVVSHDGGKTFGPNVHPYAKGRKRETEYAPFSGDALAVHIHNSQYSIEFISVATDKFALYKSDDSGKTWVGPTVSKRFEVFAPEVVEAKRNAAAKWTWINATIHAEDEACKPPQPMLGCRVETEKFWNKKWHDCLAAGHTPYECINSLPKPYPIRASDSTVGK